jgi:hypothetical protein
VSETDQLSSIYERFREFTMIDRDSYLANLHLAECVLNLPALADGCIIECGTWRGGMAAGLMSIGGRARYYHFFDSFLGLPAPGARDGAEALRWGADTSGPRYFNNCTATLDEFLEVVSKVDVPAEQVTVHAGWFEETFPSCNVSAVAVLRVDVDWYDSTRLCLERFWDLLLPGALIVIDDYYDWEGCRKAVHDFLAGKQACEAIRQSPFGRVCYVIKDGGRDILPDSGFDIRSS